MYIPKYSSLFLTDLRNKMQKNAFSQTLYSIPVCCLPSTYLYLKPMHASIPAWQVAWMLDTILPLINIFNSGICSASYNNTLPSTGKRCSGIFFVVVAKHLWNSLICPSLCVSLTLREKLGLLVWYLWQTADFL